jgi:cell division protein ZapA
VSNVKLPIAGREYTVACSPGEETHISMLGRMIDAKLSTLPNTGQSEARSFLYAALLLADELHELRAAPGAETAETLEALADRLEGLAAELESKAEGVVQPAPL